MANGWSSTFVREAEKGTGFTPPEIADDLYDAKIIEVGEPKDSPDQFNVGKTKTDFFIQWALEGDDLPTDAELRQYVTLPPAYLDSGFLNEKSNLYKLMEALGFDLGGRFTVDPPSWVGKKARVMVENKPNKDGESRPYITGVKPIRRRANRDD